MALVNTCMMPNVGKAPVDMAPVDVATPVDICPSLWRTIIYECCLCLYPLLSFGFAPFSSQFLVLAFQLSLLKIQPSCSFLLLFRLHH